MYARVARFEGASAENLRATAERIGENAGSGPPEGVPATGFMFLIDPDGGRSLGIAFFETEDDLRKGDEALNAMTPPTGEGEGRRASVETYEVAIDVSAPPDE